LAPDNVTLFSTSHTPDFVNVTNVQNPKNPVSVGSKDFTGWKTSIRFSTKGDLAYVGGKDISVFNISSCLNEGNLFDSNIFA